MCCAAARSDCQLTRENERLLQMLAADACLDRGHALPSWMYSQQSSHSILHCCCANEAISQEQPRRVRKLKAKRHLPFKQVLVPQFKCQLQSSAVNTVKDNTQICHLQSAISPRKDGRKAAVTAARSLALKLKQPHFRHFI